MKKTEKIMEINEQPLFLIQSEIDEEIKKINSSPNVIAAKLIIIDELRKSAKLTNELIKKHENEIKEALKNLEFNINLKPTKIDIKFSLYSIAANVCNKSKNKWETNLEKLFKLLYTI